MALAELLYRDPDGPIDTPGLIAHLVDLVDGHTPPREEDPAL